MTAVTHAAPLNLEDAAPVLGDFLATIMSGIDAALAEVGDDRWKCGVRDAVIREATHSALEHFVERGLDVVSAETLDAQAVMHLGRYAAVRARALSIRDRARRLDARDAE